MPTTRVTIANSSVTRVTLAAAQGPAGPAGASLDLQTYYETAGVSATVDVLQTAGRAAVGDGGGALWKRVDVQPTHAGRFRSADRYLTTGVEDLIAGGWWELVELNPSPRQAQAVADGVTDDSLSVAAAALFTDTVPVDDAVYAPTAGQTTTADAEFVGEGRLTGLYRKFVAPDGAPSWPVMDAANLIADIHMPRLQLAAAPVVVMVGDSISTYAANNTGRADMLASLIDERLQRAFPAKTITFYNRSIGGQRFQELASASTVDPAGGSTTWWNGTSWLAQVEALAPDTVFLSFGMNDRENISITSINTIVNTMLGWAKAPDIVFCTNLVPSIQAPGNDTRIVQHGRDMAAGTVRSFAKFNGYGLLDFHRQWCAVRDGFDPCWSLTLDAGSAVTLTGTTPNFNAQSSIDTIDWSCSLTVPCDEFAAGDAAKKIRFYVGPNNGDWVTLLHSAEGTIKFQRRVGKAGDIYVYADIDTGIPWPTGSQAWWVEIANDRFVLHDNAQTVAPIAAFPIMRSSGFYAPLIEGLFSVPVFYACQPVLYRRSVKDSRFYAAGGASGSTFNHPGNYLAHVYEPVLAAYNFRGVADAEPATPVVTVNLLFSDAIAMSGTLAPDATVAFGPVNYGYTMSDTVDSWISYLVPSTVTATRIEIDYEVSTAGGTVATLAGTQSFTSGGVRTSASTNPLGAITLNNVNAGTIQTAVVTFGARTYTAGDGYTFFRNASAGNDTYGPLKLIAIRMKS